jgi:hypothetical protein
MDVRAHAHRVVRAHTHEPGLCNLFWGIYLMHISSPCKYRTYELMNFTKNSKKTHTRSFHPTSSMYKI